MFVLHASSKMLNKLLKYHFSRKTIIPPYLVKISKPYKTLQCNNDFFTSFIFF